MHKISTLLCVLLLLTSVGCAKKGWVKQEVGQVHQRVDDVEGQVETNQTRIAEQETALKDVSNDVENLSLTAREALERAIEAGKLAQGKLLYEAVLSNDKVKFDFGKVDLGADAAAALDAFADTLKGYESQIYIEIQGHTDSSGAEDYNLELGQSRAEAVRRYLNSQHAVPLHRMSVISYGESAPLEDNSSREGRMRNRRVNLVVLQ